MAKVWLELADIPAEGREFSFADQAFWSACVRDMGLALRLGKPVEAAALVRPQGRGALVAGKISGSVMLPCDRCVEEFELALDEPFEVFEEMEAGGESAEEARVVEEDGRLKLDIGAVLWEQFMLALPVKPLCDSNCKGLCPSCGGNRNFKECGCSEQGGDPRMAAFRNLKIS